MTEGFIHTEFDNNEKKHVSCAHCSTTFLIEDLQRTCGNCFACSGCLIYLCPVCKSEIVVKPMKPIGSRKR